MKSNSFKLWLIYLLIIVNISFLLYILLNNTKPHFHPDRPRNIIIEKLNFNEQQINDYDLLIQTHRKNIREKDSAIIAIKNQLYAHLTHETQNQYLDSLTTQISFIQKEIETIHYHHFYDIGQLCEPNQRENYKELIREIASIFNHKPPRK